MFMWYHSKRKIWTLKRFFCTNNMSEVRGQLKLFQNKFVVSGWEFLSCLKIHKTSFKLFLFIIWLYFFMCSGCMKGKRSENSKNHFYSDNSAFDFNNLNSKHYLKRSFLCQNFNLINILISSIIPKKTISF